MSFLSIPFGPEDMAAVEEEPAFKVVPLRVKGKFAGSRTEPTTCTEQPHFRVMIAEEVAQPEPVEPPC
jgi:hypothetical protein